MSKVNCKVEEIIKNNNIADYEKYLNRAAWDTFYELSPVREGLYNWYPFKKGARILLISDGYGALAGVLAGNGRCLTVLEAEENRAECIRHRYKGLDNIVVCCGGIESLAIHERYDYIVVEKIVALRDELRQLLRSLNVYLASEGKLLIPCENRLGMKYLCGVPDSASRIPFGGLNFVSGEKRLTRSGILQELNANEDIQGYHLYYPAPDCRLPQAIYSDEYLPQKSIRDRVIPYYTEAERRGLVFLESQICDDIIENGLFAELSNAILIECGRHVFEQEVLFAALSTDRGHEHGFATIITNRQTVKKKILHPLGMSGLELIYRNQQEISEHGVACVKTTLLSDAIEMPRIQGSNCMEYLKELFDGKRREEIEDIFDQLYRAITASSEQLSFGACRFQDACLTEENAGPILRKAYLDMIPYNCFYLKENEQERKFLFYDQEFVREGYPAKYVLFRALRYSYIYVLDAESVIPLQYFKQKYELDNVWEAFEREEARFIESNRNYEQMHSFYQWAAISPEALKGGVQENRKPDLFRKKTYGIEAYRRDYQLNKIKKVELQILSELIRVCEEKELTYCVFYGTLLGAVRHQGYIPWDDDIDILMPREDYDKLLEAAETVFKAPYFLQTPESDSDCFYGGYSKLRDSSTTGLEERNKEHNCNQGIWIDIFPLDYLPKSEEEKEKQQKRIGLYQRMLFKKTYPEKRVLWDLTTEEEEWVKAESEMYSREKLCRMLHKAMTDFEGDISDKVAVLARYRGNAEAQEYSVKNFEFVIPTSFEQIQVMVPVGYEDCLRAEYGDNYLYYALAQERKPHHRAIFDTEISYVDYIEQHGYN